MGEKWSRIGDGYEEEESNEEREVMNGGHARVEI